MIDSLKTMKAQTRVVMKEAIKASRLFDAEFELIVYQQFKKGDSVNWDVLKEITLYNEFNLPSVEGGNITSTRHKDTSKGDLVFIVKFDRGSILTRHEHDCVEVVDVMTGFLDVILGSERAGTLEHKRINQGESIVVPIQLDYQFTNSSKEQCLCNVTYINK